MTEKRTIDTALAVADIAFGALALVFFALGRLAAGFILPLPVFSAPFLITIALPAFLVLSGIASLARATFSPVIALFSAFLVVINSLATLFSTAAPVFLDRTAPGTALIVFRYVLPAAAGAFYCLRALAAFLEQRRNKADAPAAGGNAFPGPQENSCAACGARLSSADDACPACGAIIRGRHCRFCGHEGKESDFTGDACPRCGRSDDAPEK
jgi:hypothetical protein